MEGMKLPVRTSHAILRNLRAGQDVVLTCRRKRRRTSLRVYSLESYLQKKVRMREVIQRHKPWLSRQRSKLGPIGTRALGVKGRVGRAQIYGKS